MIVNIYFLIIKRIQFIKILLTVLIYCIFNPISLFSLSLCDESTDIINNDLVEKNNNYYYYGILTVLGMLSLTSIYLITCYYCPNIDVFDIYNRNAINNLNLQVSDLTLQVEALSRNLENNTIGVSKLYRNIIDLEHARVADLEQTVLHLNGTVRRLETSLERHIDTQNTSYRLYANYTSFGVDIRETGSTMINPEWTTL